MINFIGTTSREIFTLKLDKIIGLLLRVPALRESFLFLDSGGGGGGGIIYNYESVDLRD